MAGDNLTSIILDQQDIELFDEGARALIAEATGDSTTLQAELPL